LTKKNGVSLNEYIDNNSEALSEQDLESATGGMNSIGNYYVKCMDCNRIGEAIFPGSRVDFTMEYAPGCPATNIKVMQGMRPRE